MTVCVVVAVMPMHMQTVTEAERAAARCLVQLSPQALSTVREYASRARQTLQRMKWCRDCKRMTECEGWDQHCAVCGFRATQAGTQYGYASDFDPFDWF